MTNATTKCRCFCSNTMSEITFCSVHAAAPALVEALETLTSAIDLSKLNVRKDFSLLNAHASARKALAQAKGGA